MDFPSVNAIPQPSAQSGVVPQLPAVKPVEPAGRTTNDDAGSVRQNPEPSTSVPEQRSGELEFRVDENTDRLIVAVYDDKGEVIRQIPSEVVLKMAEQITEVLDVSRAKLEQQNAGGAA